MQVNFYAAAADAAGLRELEVPGPLNTAELLARLGGQRPALAAVLQRCSILVDGRRVSEPTEPLPERARVDVLPPFAGG